MKKFLIFMLVFVGMIQLGVTGLPPTTLKGLFSEVRNTTFNFFVPNKQAVKVTGGTLIETGNKNILENSGFEHSTFSTGWTLTGTATYSGTTVSGEVLSGLKSLKAVASAQTISIVQDSTIGAAARAGSQMFYRFAAKNTAVGITACIRKNSVTQSGTNDCLTIATDEVTKTYELAFLADGTSNGIEILGASTTGTLIVDDVEISTESASFIDVAQIGPWIAYTPVFQGLAPSSINFFYRINGSNLDIRGTMVLGTTTAVEARIGLPSGFTSAESSIIPALSMVGRISRGAVGSTYFGSSILIEPNVTYMTIGTQTSGLSEAFKVNGSTWAGATEVSQMFASIPVQGLSNKVTTYSQQCVKDVDCENEISAHYNTSTVLDVFGNTLPVVKTLTANYLKTIDITAWGLTSTPNCVASSNDNNEALSSFLGAVPFYRKISSSPTSIVFATRRTDSTESDPSFSFKCTKTGADFKAKNVITGTFKDVVTTPNAGKVVLCSSLYDSSNAELNDYCGFVVSNSGTSPRTWTFVTDFWAELPNCWCNAGYGSGLDSGCDTHSVSVTGATTRMYNGGSLVNNNVTLFCHGKIK